VLETVTPSKLHLAITSTTGGLPSGLPTLRNSKLFSRAALPPALDKRVVASPVEIASTDRLGKTARVIAKQANNAAAISGMYLGFDGGWGNDLDMQYSSRSGFPAWYSIC
jgi:hypothetical protein